MDTEVLLKAFYAALGTAELSCEVAALGHLLESLLQEAQSQHPALCNGDGALLGSEAARCDLVRYIAERLPGYKPAKVELSALHIADLFLCFACASAHGRGILEVEKGIRQASTIAGRKLSMNDDDCQELAQLVREKLLVPKSRGESLRIASYAGTGALKSWLYATALRTGLNELRRRGRTPTPIGDEGLLVAMPDTEDDPQMKYMKETYRNVFAQSFKASVGTLEIRQANVLRHYYLDEMTFEEIGSLYRVHKTTVMRWINRAHADLEAATKEAMMRELNLEDGEVQSIVRMIQSGIQLGLSSALARD